MIKLEGVTKTFRNGELEVQVLHGIDLEIRAGEFVAIMGASGSGKSTLMNILGCLDRPTSGTYVLDGKDVSRMSKDDLASPPGKVVAADILKDFPSLHAMGMRAYLDSAASSLRNRRTCPRPRRRSRLASSSTTGCSTDQSSRR